MSPRRNRVSGGGGGASRIQQAIYGATRRLEGHTIALGLLVAAIGLVMAVVAFQSVNGVPFQKRYKLNAIVPADAPVVAEGDTVRIAGRLAGLVTKVEPRRGSRKVSMELRPSFAPVGSDARAKVRVKSLVYLTYVELTPGDTKRPMPDNGTIPLQRASSNVDLLEVVRLFDRRSREALKRTIVNTGFGFAGRGGELNEGLGDLRPISRDGTAQLRALTRKRGAIARSIAGAQRTSRGLRGERGDDVAGLLSAGDTTLGTVAGRSRELDETIRLLRPVSDELLATAPLANPVLDDTIELTEALTPVFARLERALPGLNRVLASGDRLRRETDRLTGFLRPVLRAAIPVIASLEPTVAMIDPLRTPLNVLIDTLEPYADDVTRSSEQITSATSKTYPEGQTAPGNVVLRFAPVFSCHPHRNPYPKPGEARRQARPC